LTLSRCGAEVEYGGTVNHVHLRTVACAAALLLAGSAPAASAGGHPRSPGAVEPSTYTPGDAGDAATQREHPVEDVGSPTSDQEGSQMADLLLILFGVLVVTIVVPAKLAKRFAARREAATKSAAVVELAGRRPAERGGSWPEG
jgi:hypothetical protein